MTKEEHIEAHKKLHHNLDLLVADFIVHTDKSLGKTSILELIQWSHQQTIDPSEED